MTNADVLNEQFTIERGVIAARTDDADMTAGSPCQYLNGSDGLEVTEYLGDMSRFAGVMNKALANDTQSSNALVVAGTVKVNFLNHASAIASTDSAPVYCEPVMDQTYFTYTARRTRFKLQSNQSSGTAVHTVANGDPATITILPVEHGDGMVISYFWDSPAALNTQALKSAYAASSGTATTVSTFTAQPDFARQITIQPTGTTTNVAAGTFVATGTDIHGNAITDEITTGADQTSATVSASSKAFKTVTSISVPGQDGASAQFNIGYNDALGLPFRQRVNGNFRTFFNGTFESTAATVTTDATTIAENTLDPNTALDASGDVEAYFISGCLA